jgi:hypothetical protein
MRTQGSSSKRNITNTANIPKFIQKLAVREYIGEPPVSDRAAARLGTAGEGIELQFAPRQAPADETRVSL